MSSSPTPTPPADKPELWNPTHTLPQDEDLLIVFHGLLSFCYITSSGLPHCQVGVFNQAADHQLRIRIDGGSCGGPYEYTHPQLTKLANASFQLETVGAPPDVAFYHQTALLPFNRDNAPDPFDFRWLIDVESPDLYDYQVPRKRPHYGPKLLVRNGTFFTQEKTVSTFEFVNRMNHGDERMLGSIAFCTAAKIKLSAGQQARFTFKAPDGSDVVCAFDPIRPGSPPAKIFFTNLCYTSTGKVCHVNDFHHHFGSFDPPSGKQLYDLQVVQAINAPHSCAGLNPLSEIKITPFGTDDAPCHSMGYGRSPGGTG